MRRKICGTLTGARAAAAGREQVAEQLPPELRVGGAWPLSPQPRQRQGTSVVDPAVMHKALAGLPQDRLDIEGIVRRQGDGLDLVYLRWWLDEVGGLAGGPEARPRFERAWRSRESRSG